MSDSMSLTPFEEQVFEVLVGLVTHFGFEPFVSYDIYAYGRPVHGDGWAQETVARTHLPPDMIFTGYRETHPTINLALGRLASKGLVERHGWSAMESHGYQAG